MHEIIFSENTDREVIYQELLPQISSIVETGPEMVISNMANVSAILKEALGFFWIGFYIVKNDQLLLGPFQGSLACTRISKGKGVCGTSWEKGQSIIVPDVEKFEGHIACSSLSKSEIVVPLFSNGEVFGVLDIDSDRLSDFDELDRKYLEKIVNILGF
jgi:L-methionine (R)-S-oxide reductase